jgi:hypothetical protein
VLDPDDLRDGLRAFGDASYEQFAGFSTTRPAARQAWGDAFGAYFGHVVEQFAAPGTGTSMVTSGVAAAFCGSLTLNPGMSASSAALDFADAWRAGIASVTGGTGAADPATGTTWTFLTWKDLDTPHDTLRGALEAIFSARAFSAVDDLQQIAGAFHDATSGLEANANVVTATGTIQDTLKIE